MPWPRRKATQKFYSCWEDWLRLCMLMSLFVLSVPALLAQHFYQGYYGGDYWSRQSKTQDLNNANRNDQYNTMRSQMQYRSQSQPSFYSSWGSESYSPRRTNRRERARSEKAEEMVELLRKFTTGEGTAVEATYAGVQLLVGVDGVRQKETGLSLLTQAADPKNENRQNAQ